MKYSTIYILKVEKEKSLIKEHVAPSTITTMEIFATLKLTSNKIKDKILEGNSKVS